MTSLRTPLCDLLGTELPIVQAPITGALELPLAVASAGALGMVQLSWTEPAKIPEVVGRLRGKTVGVNLVLQWAQQERLELALEHGARIVSFFWGDPAPFVQRVHEAAALAVATVASAEEARRLTAAGVDVVVAQGWEAGGHVWSDAATMALVPVVVDVVDVPVIAAGGIADGRGLAAALALGAQGAWLGTRFVASTEAPQLYKDRVVAATETATLRSTIFSEGWSDAPHRTLLNAATAAGGSHSFRMPTAPEEVDRAALYAGQSSGLVRDVRPAADLVRAIAAEAAEVLERLAR